LEAVGRRILFSATSIYARWHMFEEKREAVAIEAAALPLMPKGKALAA
jgi:hypothetical protein